MLGFCTFCDAPLDRSLEHILLSAIGGRKKSRQVVCGTHNNMFGSTIDRAVTDQLQLFSNLFAITTGRDEKAPTLRNLSTSDGTRIDLDPGGTMRARTSIEDVEGAPGQRQIRISASSLEELQRVTATYMRKYNRNIDGLEQATIHERIEPSAPVTFNGQIGGQDALRAMAKMALLLLAAEHGTHSVRGAETAPVRAFILSGGNAEAHVRQDYQTTFSLPDELAGLAEHSHRLAVYTSATSGVALGFVELYGTFRFTVLLSGGWRGPSGAIFYGVDPTTGEQAEARSTSAPPLSVADFRALNGDVGDVQKRVHRLFQLIERRRMDVSVARITEEVWAEEMGPDHVGTVITADDAARIAPAVTSRIMAAHFGRVHLKELDPKVALRPPNTAPTKTTGRKKRRRK